MIPHKSTFVLLNLNMARCVFFLIAAVCFALVASDEQQIVETKALFQKCYQETSTTADNLKAFANGETYPDETKCLLKCFMQGINGLKEDGSIDADAVVKFATEARRGTSEKCTTEATDADLCEKAHQYQKCFLAAENAYYRATVAKLTS